MESESPREQKAIGRGVRGFRAEEWEAVAKDYVYFGNWAKFSQNPPLLKLLLDTTASTTLVEASPYDTIWGIGLGEEDPRARERATWRGTNWLGEVLTRVRDDLRKTKEEVDIPTNQEPPVRTVIVSLVREMEVSEEDLLRLKAAARGLDLQAFLKITNLDVEGKMVVEAVIRGHAKAEESVFWR